MWQSLSSYVNSKRNHTTVYYNIYKLFITFMLQMFYSKLYSYCKKKYILLLKKLSSKYICAFEK